MAAKKLKIKDAIPAEQDVKQPYKAEDFDQDVDFARDDFDEGLTLDDISTDPMLVNIGPTHPATHGTFRVYCQLDGELIEKAGVDIGYLHRGFEKIVENKPYRIFGYKGKQVRDNIHSADLVDAFLHFYRAPRCGEVYNIGGSRHSNCSMMEAIRQGNALAGNELDYTYVEDNRIGDHIWYISDVSKFRSHYPDWEYRYNIDDILQEIFEACTG